MSFGLRGRRKNEEAPCVGSTSFYYGPTADLRQEPEVERRKREAICKQMCQGCFMRLECLRYALLNKEEQGVWGGMSEDERRALKRRAARARRAS